MPTATTKPQLSPTAQTVVDKVRALREYTQRTGWRTTKSQNELIQAIRNPDDLAAVIIALKN
jgi:hypothetical protein